MQNFAKLSFSTEGLFSPTRVLFLERTNTMNIIEESLHVSNLTLETRLAAGGKVKVGVLKPLFSVSKLDVNDCCVHVR